MSAKNEAERHKVKVQEERGKMNLEPNFPFSGRLMKDHQPGNPLHGITLEMMLTRLVADYGWTELGRIIDIRCFNHEPSIKSSLKFLRKTPWARNRVEDLFIRKR